MERKVIQQTVLKFINTEIGNMEAINRFGVARIMRAFGTACPVTYSRVARPISLSKD